MRDNKDIEEAILEISQSRSRYQIEKFVIGQHGTPEMQYYQLVLEAKSLISSIEETKLQQLKLESEIEELDATGKKSDYFEARLKELKLKDIQITLSGNQKELDYIRELFEQFPKFTREEIEKGQADYWENRLLKVAQMQMLSRQGGVDWAQLEALQQANIIEESLTEIPTMSKIRNSFNRLTISEEQNDN